MQLEVDCFFNASPNRFCKSRIFDVVLHRNHQDGKSNPNDLNVIRQPSMFVIIEINRSNLTDGNTNHNLWDDQKYHTKYLGGQIGHTFWHR